MSYQAENDGDSGFSVGDWEAAEQSTAEFTRRAKEGICRDVLAHEEGNSASNESQIPSLLLVVCAAGADEST